MRVVIALSKDGKEILTVKDYTNVKDKGQIGHFLAELELIKLDLLEAWEKFEDSE